MVTSDLMNLWNNVFFFGRDFTLSCLEEIAIDRENPKWHYYFLCGLKGIQVRDAHSFFKEVLNLHNEHS